MAVPSVSQHFSPAEPPPTAVTQDGWQAQSPPAAARGCQGLSVEELLCWGTKISPSAPHVVHFLCWLFGFREMCKAEKCSPCIKQGGIKPLLTQTPSVELFKASLVPPKCCAGALQLLGPFGCSRNLQCSAAPGWPSAEEGPEFGDKTLTTS